jgi:RNA-directed DNA polymerase
MAAVLVIGAIFEVDLLPQQHGFRPELDAEMALRRVYRHVTQHGRREVRSREADGLRPLQID